MSEEIDWEQKEKDADYQNEMAYERMRDYETDKLEEGLQEIIKKAFESSPYYKDRKWKIFQHLKDFLAYLEQDEAIRIKKLVEDLKSQKVKA